MATARIPVTIDGEHTEVLSLAYDIVGDTGPYWVLTPGGRFQQRPSRGSRAGDFARKSRQPGAALGST